MSGVHIVPHYDAADNTVTIAEWQDCAPVLDQNARLRSERQKSDWGRHVGTIPNIILNRWLHEEFNRGNATIKMFSREFDDLVERKLRDPDWKWLRVDK